MRRWSYYFHKNGRIAQKYENLKRALFFIDTLDNIEGFYLIDLTEVEKIVIDPVVNEYMSGEHKEA